MSDPHSSDPADHPTGTPPAPDGTLPPPADSAPGWGWPAAPAAPTGWAAPGERTASAPPTGPPPGPTSYPPFGASGGGPGWNYGYGYGYPGGSWGPPQPPRPDVPNRGSAARRIVATIAVIMLVLVSGSVGAVISAAVHHGSSGSPALTFPGFGSNRGSPSNSGRTNPRTAAIAAKVTPGVVDIYTTINTGIGQGQAAGTGMVITPSGEVLTNNHVIADASSIRVSLANGDSHSAKVVGYDVKDDVALLQVSNVSNLTTVTVGDSRQLAPGDEVVAIGNAGGRGGSPAVTSGAITALGQQVTAGDASTESSETLHGMIQLSAPIEPGDSGGPLADAHGRVIGMNTAAASNAGFFGQAGSSVAFAIPINTAMSVVHQIEAGRNSARVHIGDRALLGVRVQNGSGNPLAPTTPGALVAGVEPGSPAASAGISQGDVITSMDGHDLTSASALTEALFPHHPGDHVTIGWVDGSGQQHSASVQLIPGPPN